MLVISKLSSGVYTNHALWAKIGQDARQTAPGSSQKGFFCAVGVALCTYVLGKLKFLNMRHIKFINLSLSLSLYTYIYIYIRIKTYIHTI